MKGYRKHRRPGNRAKTKAENAHLAAITRAGCVCCIASGARIRVWRHG